MREIKFRAWDGKTMHDNVQGYNEGGLWRSFRCDAFSDVPNLMQYTGLKDSTPWEKATPAQRIGYTEETWEGVEIYEGDIVSCGQAAINTVEYDFGAFGISNFHAGFLLLHDQSNIEVIGNIYENGDLLDDKSN